MSIQGEIGDFDIFVDPLFAKERFIINNPQYIKHILVVVDPNFKGEGGSELAISAFAYILVGDVLNQVVRFFLNENLFLHSIKLWRM